MVINDEVAIIRRRVGTGKYSKILSRCDKCVGGGIVKHHRAVGHRGNYGRTLLDATRTVSSWILFSNIPSVGGVMALRDTRSMRSMVSTGPATREAAKVAFPDEAIERG